MAIFAVSLVLHAFLVYGLYHTRLTVKVFSVRSAVRDVLLVPPVTLTLPEPVEKYIQNYPSSGGIFGQESDQGRPGRPGQPRNGALPGGNGSGRVGGGPGSGLAPENLMKNQPNAPPSSGPSLSGVLALGSRYAEQEDGKLRINLLAIPDHIVEAPLGFENGKEGRASLLRYVRPGRFGTGPGTGAGAAGGASAGGTGTGGGGQRARATFQSPGYDISPWAKKVIDLIQLNWKIPDVQNILEKSEVRITVTIEKDGSFSAFEIAGGTNLEVFKAAAANALRTSSPLPPLPGDFPATNLDALFVFTYND